jgi:hypothetical protein
LIMVIPNNNFDPIKEGATAVFDPVAEGAVMIAPRMPDPVAAEEKAEKVWDVATELELPLDVIDEHYDTIMEIPDPDDVPLGIKAPKEHIPDEKPYAEMRIGAAPPKTAWQKTKEFFVSDRPPLPPNADRMEKLDRAFDIAIGTPLRTFLKFVKGRTFSVDELMWAGIKRITPDDIWTDEVRDMTLEEAMDWAAGYNPSGFVKTMGEISEFVGRINTAKEVGIKTGLLKEKVTGVLAKAGETAKLFGIAATVEQVSKAAAAKIDPTETEYGYEGATAVLRDMAIGAVLSFATSGVKAIWDKYLIAQGRKLALKIIGLKPGASMDEVRQASQEYMKTLSPEKIRTYTKEFAKIRRAADLANAKNPKQDVIFRGQKVTITAPKQITGEAVIKPVSKAVKGAPVAKEVVKGIKPPKPDVKTLTDKALKQLGQAERPRQIIEAEKTKELGKRAARSAMAAEAAEGEGRLSAALGQLKGQLTEYKRPDFTPLKETMPQNEIDALHDDIWKRPHNPDHFSKLNTAKAWSKVVEGFVPTRGEILLLEKQWGKEFAKGLLKKRPLGDRAWDTAADISNFMRTMLAGGDVSVAGRQLRLLGQRYPIKFFKEVGKGLGSYASENLSKIIRQNYESSDYHKEAKKYVQFFEPAGTEAVAPSERPEWYMSHYPEKTPVLGHLVRMGNRNYVETMNSFTQVIWDKLRAQDVINGVEPTEEQLTLRGKWLMSMSGRPEIGGVVGRRIAPIASGGFFAPRFAVSRFTSSTYLRHLASGDPVAREVGRNTAIAFASLIGTNIAALTLLKLALGDKVEIELDPRSPDWGKGRIGNTRIDLWAGYQQAARFLVQMTLGQYKTQAGKIKETKRLDTVGRFIRGKENPLVSLISDLYKGKTYEGDRPFAPPDGKAKEIMDELQVPELIQGVGKEAYRRMLFMWVQDFIDASVNDGWPLGFTAGALSFFGFNTASYEDTAFTKVSKFKDNIAQTEHGKNWDELNSAEQRRLERTNKQTLFDLELQANIEGARRDDYDYVGRLIEDEKKAGKKVYKKLKPENRKLLDEAGISLGLSRKIGDWEINDERYEQYQKYTAEILDAKLSKLGDLADIPIKRRVNKIELIVQIAKDKAKNMVRREAERKE